MTVTNLTPPTISGTAREGQTLQSSPGTWSFDLDFLEYAYQWERCDTNGANCVDISGATQSSYTLRAADVGSTLRLEVTATEVANTPTPTPPSPELLWSPPTLSSPTVKALTNAARSVAVGSNGDLRVTAATEDLTGSIGQIEGYNDVEMIGGKMTSSQQNEGHIIPRTCSGTFHLEGWNIVLTGAADAITERWVCPILQIQNCWIQVTTAGTTHHSDGFQTQESIINDLRFDRCTIVTNYQGIFLSNEPQNAGPARSKVTHQTLSRILFKPNVSAPATYFFKAFPPRPNADPIGTTELYDCWMPSDYRVYPNWNSWDGGDVGDYYGFFSTTKVHPVLGSWPFLRASVSGDTVPSGSKAGQPAADCGIRGDGGFWLYSNLNDVPDDVGCDPVGGTGPGRTYVSPGYQ